MSNLLPRTREAKKALKLAQDAYNRSKNYHSAVALQKAQKELDEAALEERKTWFILDGDQGDHLVDEYQLMVNALEEVVRRCKEIGNKQLPASIVYVQHVAEQALSAVGHEKVIHFKRG